MSTASVWVCLFFLSLGVGCGGTSYDDEPPPPAGPAPADDPAFTALRASVDETCGPCHNGKVHPVVFDSAAKFKTAKVRSLIEGGQMPPGGKIDATVKARLLAYLKS